MTTMITAVSNCPG